MMRRTINLLLILLFVAEVTSANTVDFDKAFKESARIEKQMMRLILAMKLSIKLFYSVVWQEVAQ